jgi:hypothetical protein
MVHCIEDLIMVDLYGVAVPSLNVFHYLLDGLGCRTTRSEPETGFRKMGIKDRSKYVGDSLLYHTIHDRGDTKIAGTATVFRLVSRERKYRVTGSLKTT